MITSNDLRKGMVVKIDGELYSVIDSQHVKNARGPAFVRAKMKSVIKGSTADKTFRGGEKIEDVRIEKRPMQYLYDEGDSLVFMDVENYEQISIEKKTIEDLLRYLKESDVVEVETYEEMVISVAPPMFVELLITYAEPGIKGDTATNVTKPVTVETGANFNVPIFVEEGDVIKIDTRTGEYVERVKK